MSGPKIVVLPIVLTITALVDTWIVWTFVTVTTDKASAPPRAIVCALPSLSVVVIVESAPIEVLVETESDVLSESDTVGTVVVTTIGEVAIGIEFCART